MTGLKYVRNFRFTKKHRPHRLAQYPWWLTRWLGYRATPPSPVPVYLVWFWTFIAAWCGIAMLMGVFSRSHYFRVTEHVPPIIVSYGASAVLIYGAIESPLAQPRAIIGGHLIGGLTGICITKLFHLVPTEKRYEQLEWCAGSLATALTIVFMQITQTTHAPAGATALLAAVNTDIRNLDWYYLPVILLSTTLALSVALIVNNVQRRYPVYWFQPAVVIPAPVSPALGAPGPTPEPQVEEDITRTNTVEDTQNTPEASPV
jgi:CBS-domain-containing membrane protein